MSMSLIIHIVPTGLLVSLYFAFYQYIIPLGQSRRDDILVE